VLSPLLDAGGGPATIAVLQANGFQAGDKAIPNVGVTALKPTRRSGKWVADVVWETREVSLALSNPVLVRDTLFGLSERAVLRARTPARFSGSVSHVRLRTPPSSRQAIFSLVVYGLPDDYYARYVPAIQAVGAADVQRVAQQYIQPDRLAIVIVGDRETIEPPLRALNLGSITDVSIDEIFAPVR
jgi:hypothetical protein